jgi:hypothetical protein
MKKPDQQKLRVLIVLLVILGLTLFVGYRMNRAPNPAIVQAEDQKPVVAQPVQTDARIRLDLLKKENPNEGLGKKNLFQYGPPPAPPAPPTAAAGNARNPVGFPHPPAASTTPPPSATNIPSTPPPPPPIPLKYIGISSIEPDSKKLIATLIDDNQHHFNAVNGDIFMGRYKISRITENSVDVDDLQYNRRQTLTLVKQ